jgi:hypothetical protein
VSVIKIEFHQRRRKKDGGEMGSLKKMDSVEQNLQVSSKDVPILYVNGVRRVLPDGLAHLTLLEYLRGIILFSFSSPSNSNNRTQFQLVYFMS